MTALIRDTRLEPAAFVDGLIEHFRQDVNDRIRRMR